MAIERESAGERKKERASPVCYVTCFVHLTADHVAPPVM